MTYSEAKAAAAYLMPRLVDPATSLVRFREMASLLRLLTQTGFHLIQNAPYGPPGGRQLFYQHGRLLLRIKTLGEEAGRFRAHQPHMAVSLMDGEGLQWMNERAKFDAHGRLLPKLITNRFQPVDFQGNQQRFVLIQGGLYDGIEPDEWARLTHFHFPEGFDFTNVASFQSAD